MQADASGGYGQPGGDVIPGMPSGPAVRENVDAGVKVINLSEMRAELEANPHSRDRAWDRGR